MKRLKQQILTVLLLVLVSNLFGQNPITRTGVISSGGYDIPIVIATPFDNSVAHPVMFYVHGGGWQGGDLTNVPNASLPTDYQIMCNRLGIVFVGLAYRCIGNNATFADAIQDLEASVAWFKTQASVYNADLSRIGWGGQSAGTSLASIMAQNEANCVLYVGADGMYDIPAVVAGDNSDFPNASTRSQYGLTTTVEQTTASAIYNLRTPIPPTALLLHGLQDNLCNDTQSINFKDQIQTAGGQATIILHDKNNHRTTNWEYPEAYVPSMVAMANFYTQEFGLNAVSDTEIEAAAVAISQDFIARNPIPSIYGNWTSTSNRPGISFNSDNTCWISTDSGWLSGTYSVGSDNHVYVISDNNLLEIEFVYINSNGLNAIIMDGTPFNGIRDPYTYLGAPYIPNPVETNYFEPAESLTSAFTHSGNSLSLSTDVKQGSSSWQMTGEGINDFYKSYSIPYDSGATEQNGVLEFWYYISDSNLIGDNLWVIISSSGVINQDYYQFSKPVSELQSGWNRIVLNTSNYSGKLGNPDLSAINFLVLYSYKTGSVTSKLDAVQLYNVSTLSTSAVEKNTWRISQKLNDNYLTIVSSDLNNDKVQFSIYDLTGKLVLKHNANPSLNEWQLDVSMLAKSLYLLKVNTNKANFTKKLVLR